MEEKKEIEEINLIDNPNNLLEPFKVYVRIRPFLKKEIIKLKRCNSTSSLPGGNNLYYQKSLESIFTVSKKSLYVHDYKHHKKDKKYFFNDIFTEKNNNIDVFDISIKPIINNIIKGYNSTALAYGVTGTGKTHTIFGDLAFKNGEEGISIKACDYLFNELSSKYFEDQFIEDTLFNSPALYMYLSIIFLILIHIITKSKEIYLMYIPNLLNILIVFFSTPVQDNRYLYANLLICYLLIIILIGLMQRFDVKSLIHHEILKIFKIYLHSAAIT